MGAGATALGRQEKCRRNAAGIPPGGFRAVLERNLSDVQRTATRKYVSPIEFAFCYARLRRKDETIRYLERAYQEQTPFLVHLPHDPNFYFVHSDPRFQAIIKKMGLPPV